MKILVLVMFFFLGLLSASCTKDQDSAVPVTPSTDATLTQDVLSMKVDAQGLSESSVMIKTIHGNIVFKLYPQKAPVTVSRILTLVKEGFYDGLIFHRVIPDFVIQGGDPTGTGLNGSGKKLKAEFNDIQHIAGTVAMARAQDPDSADSQFYIALNRAEHLDKNYTVFGQVVSGLDVCRKIKNGDKMLSVSIVE